MEHLKVFLDTDVVIASLLSSRGASFRLLHSSKIIVVISKTVREEIEEVARRLQIPFTRTKSLDTLNTVPIKVSKERVVAGAHRTRSQFLLTYNLKHYAVQEIGDDFGIIVMKPGMFLQYLRSIS